MADTLYTLDSGFWNGIWNGEVASEPVFSYDRVYDSEEMMNPYVNIVTDGIYCAERVVDNVATLVPEWTCTRYSTTQIQVGTGTAIMLGRWVRNELAQLVDIPTNNLLASRLDSIVIQLNVSERAAYLIYRTGSSSGYPDIEQGESIYEFRLYNVSVPASAVGGNPTLTDNRVTDECPAITGLLQQLDLSERLDQFDEDVQEKLDEFDAKLEEVDQEWDAKLEEVDSAWDAFLQTANNELDVIKAEWSAIKQEIEDLVGSTSIISDITVITQHEEYSGSGTITINDYNEETDRILVFINGMYANTTDDYTLSNGVITFTNSISSGAIIDIFGFRVVMEGSTVANSWASEIHTVYDGSAITIPNWESLRMTAMVFINGFYANDTDDYVIEGDGVITWRNTINNGAVIDVLAMVTVVEEEEEP